MTDGRFEAVIAGWGQTSYRRHAAADATTEQLLADAISRAVDNAGVKRSEIDGLGLSSFTITPDRVIDLAWKLGLRLRWIIQEPLGMTMMQHAQRAIEAGDANVVVIVGGDGMDSQRFRDMVVKYNATTEQLLAPIGAIGPNPQFSFISSEFRRRHGLPNDDAFGRVVIHQRDRARTHANGTFAAPLTLEEYDANRRVTDVLRVIDCVPLVAGANAVVITRKERAAKAIQICGYGAILNNDSQEGHGLELGLAPIADALWHRSGLTRSDVDLVCLYDDYPVIVLEQLVELGFLTTDDLKRLGQEGFPEGHPVVNPSGGLLCCGQAGAGGTMHGLVDAVQQLSHEAGDGQIPDAQVALVTNYGMVLYRYGACAAALLLRRMS